MDKRILADQIIETGVLFEGPWSLERVGHEQWVFRGTKDNLPKLFRFLEQADSNQFSRGKCELPVTKDMKLILLEATNQVEGEHDLSHVQLRVYDKERIETLLSRDVRKLRVLPESIQKVREWLKQAAEAGITQLSYLSETMAVFGQGDK